jgi:DNA repair exonuclease SbcCD ATPase subunit
MPNVPQWGNQAPSWEWGPRLPKELTEVKQSVESLQREITELRELIKRLETQIQLLNRTILLSSERMGERTSPPGRIVIVQDNEE